MKLSKLWPCHNIPHILLHVYGIAMEPHWNLYAFTAGTSTQLASFAISGVKRWDGGVLLTSPYGVFVKVSSCMGPDVLMSRKEYSARNFSRVSGRQNEAPYCISSLFRRKEWVFGHRSEIGRVLKVKGGRDLQWEIRDEFNCRSFPAWFIHSQQQPLPLSRATSPLKIYSSAQEKGYAHF